MERLQIGGRNFTGIKIDFVHSSLLLIKGDKGVLGCGYFDINPANKTSEALAIVTGVKNFEDMLNAKVTKVSFSAQQLGIVPEMSGREALEKLG